MVMALDAGEVTRMQDTFGVALDNILFDESDNSRAAPHADDEIAALAESILANGQLQPVLCRRVQPGNKIRLVAGFGRLKAVRHINTVLQPDAPPMKLQCRVLLDVNEETAYVASIRENIDRAATSPMDDSHAQKILRERYGWAEDRIARLYNCSVSYLSQLRKLHQLETPMQREVANGTLPVAAALDLTALPEDERREVVEKARDKKTKKVRPAKVREAVREAGGKKSRTLAEVREFLARIADDGRMKEGARELATNLVDWIGGKMNDDDLTLAFGEWTAGKALGARK